MRRGNFTAIMLSALLALGFFALPAQAAPDAFLCTGTATVTPGLHLPGFGGPADFEWTIDTDECLPDGSVSASGDGTGFCGQSSGFDGEATGEVDGHSHSFTNVGWTINAGGAFIVTGDGTNGETLVAEVFATGGVACTSEAGATSFEVAMVVEILP